MNPKQQRIAIAQACGWKTGYRDPESWHPLPDFLNDLNAMHDAEMTLTQDQQLDYSRHIGKLVTSHLPASRAAWMDFRLINATATQRAEAFLRTIAKWLPCGVEEVGK